MLILYRLFLYLAAPWVALSWLARALRDRRYFERCPQRLGFIARDLPPGGVWIHAVSVGEVNAAAPLIEHLLARHPHKAILVTTMTPTGAERVARIFAGRVRHCYLPYDYPGAVRRFLARAVPCLALVMETEIWPNLIAACAHRGVPMFCVNVRLSKRSLRGYRRYRSLLAPALRSIDRFAAQNRADARRLIHLGARADAVEVTGSLKFDIALPPEAIEAASEVRRGWGAQRPVWLAGSTHEGEEAQILDAFARLKKQNSALLLVIAPRHPQRFKRVFRLCVRRGYQTELRSNSLGDRVFSGDRGRDRGLDHGRDGDGDGDGDHGRDNNAGDSGQLNAATDICIADTMGELPMLIAAADVAFIGGSLVPVGGHNVLEASAAGVAVVFGSHMFNFAEIADQLVQHAAGIQVMNRNELAEVVQRLLADPHLRQQYATHGRALLKKNRGALKKVRAFVDEQLDEKR